MTAIHRNSEVVALCASALADVREIAPSLVLAIIVSDDGFEVTHSPDNAMDVGRFGSMTSSVQALSEAVSRELRLGDSGYVVIAAEGGHVLQLRVPGQPLILAAQFDTHETLGKALSSSRRCVENLSAALSERELTPIESDLDSE